MHRPRGLMDAIFAICTFAISQVAKKTRPYVPVKMFQSHIQALYDSGADVSCLSEKEFRKIPVQLRPKAEPHTNTTCKSASGQNLQVKGIYKIPISIMGKEILHPFRVMVNLNETMILGSDFIHQHLLAYDPSVQKLYWQDQNEWVYGVATTKHVVTIPPMTNQLLPVQCLSDKGTAIPNGTPIIANIS